MSLSASRRRLDGVQREREIVPTDLQKTYIQRDERTRYGEDRDEGTFKLHEMNSTVCRPGDIRGPGVAGACEYVAV